MKSPQENKPAGPESLTAPKSPKPTKLEMKIKRAVTAKGRRPNTREWAVIGASVAKALASLGNNVESIGIVKTTQGGCMMAQSALTQTLAHVNGLVASEDLDAATRLQAAGVISALVKAQHSLVKSTCDIQKLKFHAAAPPTNQKKSFRPLQAVVLMNQPAEKQVKSIEVQSTRS